MTARFYADTNVYLNALVESNRSMEVRTRVFSKTNLDSLLSERPAAITFSRAGVVDAERLLDAYLENDALFRPIMRSRRINQWRCYAQKFGRQFELEELVDERVLFKKAVALFKQFARTSAEASICALVPDINWTPQRDKKMRSVLCDVILTSTAGDKKIMIEAKQFARTESAAPTVLIEAAHEGDDATDREALIRVRRQMLDKVGSYSSEDLAAAAESTTSNPSQFASDQRGTGELFGVRFGREWRYPKFQFDARRHTLPEMQPVLKALSPDEHGWGRLQWFLEPHEILRGRTPLEVWKTDRKKVIEAANTERWDGRD